VCSLTTPNGPIDSSGALDFEIACSQAPRPSPGPGSPLGGVREKSCDYSHDHSKLPTYAGDLLYWTVLGRYSLHYLFISYHLRSQATTSALPFITDITPEHTISLPSLILSLTLMNVQYPWIISLISFYSGARTRENS